MSCGAAKSTFAQTRGTLSRRSKRQRRGLFRGQGGRAQGVFANPSMQFDECIVLPPAGPPAILPRAKTLACKGVFARPSMQCGGRMYAKAERPSVLPRQDRTAIIPRTKTLACKGVFARPSMQCGGRMYAKAERPSVLPRQDRTAIIPRTKTLACKGVFARPSMQCGGRMYAKAERPSVLPSAGPHCYYNTSGALCHHLKLFFCKNLCARPMGNFTKTTLHKIICMLQSNR